MEAEKTHKRLNMTVRQWFNLMLDPYKSAAIAEASKEKFRLDLQVSSLSRALQKFSWRHSKQGDEYWTKVHQDLQIGKQIKYIDTETITQIFE